jgi:hypothetical protein
MRPSWPIATWTWRRFTRDSGGEAALLTTYFGRAPDPEERARFDVMRLVNHLFAGLIFLNVAATERPGLPLDDRTLAGPSLVEIHERLRTGAFAILEWENRVTYGKARLVAALEGFRAPAANAALALLAA